VGSHAAGKVDIDRSVPFEADGLTTPGVSQQARAFPITHGSGVSGCVRTYLRGSWPFHARPPEGIPSRRKGLLRLDRPSLSTVGFPCTTPLDVLQLSAIRWLAQVGVEPEQ
jgi:hypothetical protein